MDNKSDRRLMSGSGHSVRLFEDNSKELIELCNKTGQKHSDALRELVDEALRARRAQSINLASVVERLEKAVEQITQLVEQNQALDEQNRMMAERIERMQQKSEEIEERSLSLKQGLNLNLRLFYAVLLQVLFASFWSKRMVWDYVALTVLKASGFTEEEISQRYQKEMKESIEEGRGIAVAAEKDVEKMELSHGIDGLDGWVIGADSAG
jgi:hypothetical protein